LLLDFGKVHPQALVYRLILACNTTGGGAGGSASAGGVATTLAAVTATAAASNNAQLMSQRNVAAARILQVLREHNSTLVDQAKLVSEELIRVAILWHEMWHESLEEASKLYFGEKNVRGMLETLDVLHMMMDRGPTTSKESAFLQAYGRDLNDARECCRRYRSSLNVKEIDAAWDKYYSVFKRITRQLSTMSTLELSYVSPRLMISRDLELAVPGTYQPSGPLIHIRAFNANIQGRH
jgi:FKBP12-rapamycin complex-associated protein